MQFAASNIPEPETAFEEAKKLLQTQRHEFEALASLKAARMNELRAELHKRQHGINCASDWLDG